MMTFMFYDYRFYKRIHAWNGPMVTASQLMSEQQLAWFQTSHVASRVSPPRERDVNCGAPVQLVSNFPTFLVAFILFTRQVAPLVPSTREGRPPTRRLIAAVEEPRLSPQNGYRLAPFPVHRTAPFSPISPAPFRLLSAPIPRSLPHRSRNLTMGNQLAYPPPARTRHRMDTGRARYRSPTAGFTPYCERPGA